MPPRVSVKMVKAARRHAQMWSRPITFLGLWPATDDEPHCRHVPIKKFEDGVNLLHEADDEMQSYGWNLQRLQHSRNK